MTERWCDLCASKGLQNKLQHFNVNFKEGILLCENTMCVYPFGARAVDSLLVGKSCGKVAQRRKIESKSVKNKRVQSLTSSSGSLPSYFYWCNTDSLCWLDSVLTILVNNRCLQLCLTKLQNKDLILQKLCHQFHKAQNIGKGNKGKLLLSETRKGIFEYLKSRMQCELGVNDSPLAALQLLLKNDKTICEKFTTEYLWKFKCAACEYEQIDRFKKQVISFPNTTEEFAMPSCYFLRACYKCKSPKQRCNLEVQQMPPCVMVHFVEGVSGKDFLKSHFSSHGKDYQLYQLIQYKRNPDHFVSWIRNGPYWTEVDDMKNSECAWKEGEPSLPVNEIHIAVWERVSLHRKNLPSKDCKKAVKNINQSNSSCPVSVSTNKMSGETPKVSSPLLSNRTPTFSQTFIKPLVKRTTVSQTLPDLTKAWKENTVEKRKAISEFQPYIPRKKRNLFEDINSTNSYADNTAVTTDGMSDRIFLPWQDAISVDTEGKRKPFVIDNQSDSGYSSPGSNGSSLSLSSVKEQATFDEFIESLESLDLPNPITLQQPDSHSTLVNEVDAILGEIFSKQGIGSEIVSDLTTTSSGGFLDQPATDTWSHNNIDIDDILANIS